MRWPEDCWGFGWGEEGIRGQEGGPVLDTELITCSQYLEIYFAVDAGLEP